MGTQTSFLHETAVSALKGLIRVYQYVLSPFMGKACRFVPTCSCYAHEALERHGIRAVPMIIWRIMRCNPFTGRAIEHDPVPPLLEKTHGPA